MLTGERGTRVLELVREYRLEGLLDGDEPLARMLAALMATAIREGRTPRQVLDDVWKSVPDDDTWTVLAETVTEVSEP